MLTWHGTFPSLILNKKTYISNVNLIISPLYIRICRWWYLYAAMIDSYILVISLYHIQKYGDVICYLCDPDVCTDIFLYTYIYTYVYVCIYIYMPYSNQKVVKPSYTSISIRIIKMRRSWDRLIFIMRISILIRLHIYIESVPWFTSPTLKRSRNCIEATRENIGEYITSINLNIEPASIKLVKWQYEYKFNISHL